jgi:hypothetical protein
MSKRGSFSRAWALAAILTAVLAGPAPAAQQTYRDYSLGTLGMIAQSMVYDEANLIVLGESSTPGIYQTAMLISRKADMMEDAGARNVILFECGMHGREFFAAESCYWLIDHLLQNLDSVGVKDLLRRADVWVIPQSNPAGRMIDDLRWGDPTRFFYFCDDGPDVGQPCETNDDCGSPGQCWTAGWRSNANHDDCELGTDLARNYSGGWDDATATCGTDLCVGGTLDGRPCPSAGCPGGSCKNRRMWYRGDNPFSEPESLNLRRFVHNHMISMAAVVHTDGQTLENRWYDESDAIKYIYNPINNLT